MLERLNSIVGNYGVTVAIATAVAFLFIIPFRIFRMRNDRIKARVAPRVAEIHKKYGINSLGASVTEKIDSSETELIAMDPKEREQRAAEEIDRIHRENGYHFFIGLLPGIVETIFIFILYFAISSSCPDGLFKTKAFAAFWTFSGSAAVMVIYGVFYAVNVLIGVPDIIENRKNNTKKKAVLFGTRAVALALMVFVSYRAIPAILIAITTLQVLSNAFRLWQVRAAKKKG